MMNLMLNKNTDQETGEVGAKAALGQQLMAYSYSIREGGWQGESKEAYAARIYAKARSGQRLTPEEMNFLARTNPELYRKVLRAQTMRRDLENRLKRCRSKQEAQEVFAAAVGSISEKDPDREMLLQALNQAFKEFQESSAYGRLPETKEEAEEGKRRGTMEFVQNESGYQEVYMMAQDGISFAADA